MSHIHVGTSGWVYSHWREIFYPPKLPQRLWLDFYVQKFSTVEVNFTFYRLPAESTCAAWATKAPAGFHFAIKGSRFITHVRRLKDVASSVERLAERLDVLGQCTGPVLWQLPPDFERDETLLGAFLEVLPKRFRHAFEFRHASWLVEPIFDLLHAHQAALCIPDRADLPKDIRLTTDWAYFRFHGGADTGDYSDEQLDWWASQIARLSSSTQDVWAYFNNDWNGYALKNARGLLERLTPKLRTGL